MDVDLTSPIPPATRARLRAFAGRAYSTLATVHATYRCSVHALRASPLTAPCLVECGVGAGTQLAAMCQAKQDVDGVGGNIIGLDSFEGIPLATHRDDEQPGVGPVTVDPGLDPASRLVSSGITVHSEEAVRRHLRDWGFDLSWLPWMTRVHLFKGWFQNTLPQLAPRMGSLGGIQLLRLDGDLYESTKVCLDHLLPHVVPGGIVIVDDWNLKGAREAVHEQIDIVTEIPPGGDPLYLQCTPATRPGERVTAEVIPAPPAHAQDPV